MKPVFVMLVLLAWGECKAEQIYVLFDDACGNRIRYERTVGEESRMDYFSYSFSLGGGTELLFETDGEGVALQRSLPENYLNCNDLRLTSDLAERINTGEAQLFIVLEDGDDRYQVQPVVMAALFEQQGSTLGYRSPFADFSFSLDNTVIGVDLGRGNEGAIVYFEGSEGLDCTTGYLFQQQNPQSAYPVIDYKLVPGLGITERRLTGNGTYTTGGNITATEVNGMPLQEYLEMSCATAAEESEPAYTEAQENFIPYYVEAEAPSIYTQQSPVINAEEASDKAVPYAEEIYAPAEEVATPSPVGATAIAPVVIHRVSKGETLYALSRRYGLSVNTIRAENGLDGNTIFPGQELRIAKEESPADSYATEEFVGEEAAYSYDVPDTEPVTASPVQDPYPVVVPPAPAATDDYPAPAVTSAQFHTVQRGETIASLALRYGYTTARFREFNELGNQEVPLVGQQLRTTDCNCPPAAPAGVADVPRPSNYISPAPTADPVEVSQGNYPETYPTPVPVERTSPVNIVVPPARPAPATPTVNPPAYGGGGVPVNTASSPAAVYPATSTAPTERRATHEVREGESLYGIARQYGVTVTQLLELNDLRPADVIVPFQKLYVN